MTNDQNDEFHTCPACGQRTRHRVSRDRKIAPVAWCQRCFHVHVLDQSADTHRPTQPTMKTPRAA